MKEIKLIPMIDIDHMVCPICHKYKFEYEYDICPFCGWENDGTAYDYPNMTGANTLTIHCYYKWYWRKLKKYPDFHWLKMVVENGGKKSKKSKSKSKKSKSSSKK